MGTGANSYYYNTKHVDEYAKYYYNNKRVDENHKYSYNSNYYELYNADEHIWF